MGYLDFKRERMEREWYVTEGGTMECISNELGKGDCGLCRLSVDRYYTRKWLVTLSNNNPVE